MAGAKRRNLADLVVPPSEGFQEPGPGESSATITQLQPTGEPAAAVAPEPAAPREPDAEQSRPTPTRKTAVPKAPRYMQLTRKEARIREEQYDRLTAAARRLERRRPTSHGERITENTLIRIAIDLLLEREKQLDGATEDEIRKSVTP